MASKGEGETAAWAAVRAAARIRTAIVGASVVGATTGGVVAAVAGTTT